ncbi:MAG TPA: hypothetical protein ENH25_03375 [candidate division Zixibacteria bacterium]|nr:hypothetical protein [candidate division Zixibacteria bacterium]
MQNHLADSTALYGAGISTGKKIFKISSGRFAGRIVALMQTSPTEIKLSCAEYPYTDWTPLQNIVNDCADSPFDAVMDGEHNICLVYTLGVDSTLVCRKLAFVQGIWVVGDSHVIYDSDSNVFPSVAIEQPDRLWVTWTRNASGQYYINAKKSDNDGVSWGSGSSSYGDEIALGNSSAFARVQPAGSYIYLVYTVDGSRMSYRRRNVNLEIWENESDIATGSGFDEHFDTAISGDERLGVVYDNSGIRFREYDGSRWLAICTIDENGGEFPCLRYFNNDPYVVYLSEFTGNTRKILFSRRLDNGFSDPQVLDSSQNTFDKALCYNAVVASYHDLTAEAADSNPGDMYFPESAVIFKSPGDALYLGMNSRFHALKIILSAVGTGGSVGWQYYNGQDWVGFAPAGGACDFDSTDRELLLWDDLASVPGDWQKYSLGGSRLFWIKAAVTSEFDTGPVGTHISTVSAIGAIALMEN